MILLLMEMELMFIGHSKYLIDLRSLKEQREYQLQKLLEDC